MKVYKLCTIKRGKLYPMYVGAKKELTIGEWLTAEVGEVLEDGKHVKSKLGPLSLRPGFHSAPLPYSNWIGHKEEDGTLSQRSNTVWAECEVIGDQVFPEGRNGMRTIPEGWYYFKTNSKMPFPWIISKHLFIYRVLTHEEVEEICRQNGYTAQPMAQ